MGPVSAWLASIAELELALPRYEKSNRYIIHDAALPLPDFAMDFEYDAIVMNSTFLGAVFHPQSLELVRRNYEFVEKSGSVKIALPQDEYYCSEELDSLLVDWKIDLTYSVCSEKKEVLFPKYISSGGAIKHGFTGYITPGIISWFQQVTERAERKFDVVYKAS